MATSIEAEDAFDLATLPAVQTPTLLVGGGRDRFYDPAPFVETADLISECKLEMHSRRGHITVLNDPRAIAQIRGFLSHASPARSASTPPVAQAARRSNTSQRPLRLISPACV